ncbi:MAG: carbohydrate-binding family 9-like protein [Planctomycetota bacterium]|nr:MAG: carbohydrate-binding family 9-like protein [Planctomycetota bacterium]
MIRLTAGLILTAAAGCASNPCPKTYDVRYVPEARINVDGILDESDWNKAYCETDFSFPWEDRAAPATKFRALRDDDSLYFFFNVHDEDVVVEEKFDTESVVAREDRVEIFFAYDDKLKEYFCLEVDPLGRVLDYAASYYRRFDNSWSLPGVRAAASITSEGYTVEGSAPLKSLEALGLPPLGPGRVLKVGLFRADFNRGQNSKLHEHWISWVDPGTKQPDFHVPSAFGCLRIAE